MRIHLSSAKFRIILAVWFLLLNASVSFSQTDQPFSINESPLPPPTGYVNDFAGVMDAETKQSLEQKIKQFKEKTNPPVELAVAVVKTTGDRPIFDYSLAVARGWGIGSKNDDNPGALLFVAIEDRKYFTQVSRNLEDELPDGLVGQLQRQYLVPEFRKGNYAKGISDTVEAYIRTIEQKQSGEPVATTETETKQPRQSGGFSICNTVICLVVLFIFLIVIFGGSGRPRRSKKDRDRWGGGGGSGGDSGSALPWIVGSIIANSLSSGSSGSDWGSSDWGGSSGSDWGGFGGGGDFGGGGAGGDW